jgi:hypothetical protein
MIEPKFLALVVLDFFKNIKVSDLWKFWGGILLKLFFKNSFLDITLFTRLSKAYLESENGREVYQLHV